MVGNYDHMVAYYDNVLKDDCELIDFSIAIMDAYMNYALEAKIGINRHLWWLFQGKNDI